MMGGNLHRHLSQVDTVHSVYFTTPPSHLLVVIYFMITARRKISPLTRIDVLRHDRDESCDIFSSSVICLAETSVRLSITAFVQTHLLRDAVFLRKWFAIAMSQLCKT